MHPFRKCNFPAVPNLGMILIFAAALASPSPSPLPDACGGAQTNLLAALNRPSIGFSACAVKRGEGVAELGYQNTVGATTHLGQVPQGFLRYGAAPNFEVDFIGPSYGISATGARRTSGFFDSGFGAKYEAWHDGDRAFAIDLLYTVPSGKTDFSAGAPTQTLNLDYAMPISRIFSFGTTLGLQNSYAGGRFFSTLPSALIADQWNARTQAFLEAFAQTKIGPAGGSLFGTDVALQYLLQPALEVDAELGSVVSTPNGRSHYVGIGLGARF